MESLGFSSFRSLMDTWDNYLESEDKEAKIRKLLDGQGLILFFKKGKEIYGAPEQSRVIFAKMKTPDEDVNDDWMKEANFMALNLGKALTGEEVENMFSAKDLKSIKVMDRDKVEKLLKKMQSSGEQIDYEPPHDEEGAGVIQLKDKE